MWFAHCWGGGGDFQSARARDRAARRSHLAAVQVRDVPEIRDSSGKVSVTSGVHLSKCVPPVYLRENLPFSQCTNIIENATIRVSIGLQWPNGVRISQRVKIHKHIVFTESYASSSHGDHYTLAIFTNICSMHLTLAQAHLGLWRNQIA